MAVHPVNQADLDYFIGQLDSNAEFWRRFGTRPSFAGKRVLDIGCGHGALSIEIARDGATVVGIDPDGDRVGFAEQHLAAEFPDLAENIEFRAVELDELETGDGFDFALSKDTFEHVADMEAMLRSISDVLRPGGQLWTGFAPLYYSPWGDHGRVGLRLPWLHGILPKRLVYRAASRHRRHRVESLVDIGLNGLTPSEFRRHLAAAGFEVESIQYNRGDKRLLTVLQRLRAFGPLEKWATVSIYAVLRKP